MMDEQTYTMLDYVYARMLSERLSQGKNYMDMDRIVMAFTISKKEAIEFLAKRMGVTIPTARKYFNEAWERQRREEEYAEKD